MVFRDAAIKVAGAVACDFCGITLPVISGFRHVGRAEAQPGLPSRATEAEEGRFHGSADRRKLGRPWTRFIFDHRDDDYTWLVFADVDEYAERSMFDDHSADELAWRQLAHGWYQVRGNWLSKPSFDGGIASSVPPGSPRNGISCSAKFCAYTSAGILVSITPSP